MKQLKILKGIRIPEWLCKNGTKDSLLNAKEKNKIRKHILPRAIRLGSYFGLYGEGEEFIMLKNLLKKLKKKIRIRMLDNGEGFGNKAKLKEIAEKTQELLLQNFKKFAKEGRETFAVLWLDFCGQMSHLLLEYIRLAPRIMQGKGEIYITIMETRDSMFPKWMTREQRREQTIRLIIDEFKAKGVILKVIYQKRYGSIPMRPDRKTMRQTPMWTIGFAYEKI
ncbi:MAG: hypothetical protein Q7R56_00415 [Nanoarchaeota archaeon]|nr:hypothetical protein [Nanoarchaeota archaeon]